MATRSDSAIRDADNRRARLKQWIDERFGGSQAAFVAAHNLNQGEISGLLNTKSFGGVKARNLEEAAGMPLRYLDEWQQGTGTQGGADVTLISLPPAPHQSESGDLVITQFDAGGGMDTNGHLLLEDQPGVIRSWNVSEKWLHLNVPSYTSLKNLCIVTGFGPSMRPMFNPGDPLLVDRGVNIVNHEGIYFFRVGDEGFIKIIQRVPEFDGPGFVYRIISKNSDYPPYDISAKNPHFQVIGKVLTVWCSEQF